MTATSALYAKTRSQLFISLRLSALVVAALVMATGISLAGIKSPLAFISQGPVRGLALPGENEFLGIPYAAPPVGDLRWQPPHKPAFFTGIF
jgi:para-nitrobenzyl esterase